MEINDVYTNIPNDLIIYIALQLDLPELLNYCRVSQKFNSLVCQNNSFWINRLKQDFNITYTKVNNDNPKLLYQKIYHLINEYKALVKIASRFKEVRLDETLILKDGIMFRRRDVEKLLSRWSKEYNLILNFIDQEKKRIILNRLQYNITYLMHPNMDYEDHSEEILNSLFH